MLVSNPPDFQQSKEHSIVRNYQLKYIISRYFYAKLLFSFSERCLSIFSALSETPTWQVRPASISSSSLWRSTFTSHLHVIPACHVCMSYLHDIPACQVCMSYLHVVPACHTRMSYLHVIPACHTCMPGVVQKLAY